MACLKCMIVDGYTVCLVSICIKKNVAHLTCDKREMPVFGIVHDEILSGIVVRIIWMRFKFLSKPFFPLGWNNTSPNFSNICRYPRTGAKSSESTTRLSFIETPSQKSTDKIQVPAECNPIMLRESRKSTRATRSQGGAGRWGINLWSQSTHYALPKGQ